MPRAPRPLRPATRVSAGGRPGRLDGGQHLPGGVASRAWAMKRARIAALPLPHPVGVAQRPLDERHQPVHVERVEERGQVAADLRDARGVGGQAEPAMAQALGDRQAPALIPRRIDRGGAVAVVPGEFGVFDAVQQVDAAVDRPVLADLPQEVGDVDMRHAEADEIGAARRGRGLASTCQAS